MANRTGAKHDAQPGACTTGRADAPDETGTRPEHGWLLDVTQIPTAAGREQRVIRWIERWVREREDLALSNDGAGNLVVRPRKAWGRPVGQDGHGGGPVYITAHLDHPAFVVERIVSPDAVEVSFRGGVMDDFFEDAPVTLVTAEDERVAGRVTAVVNGDHPVAKTYLVELEGDGSAERMMVGDVGVWALPEARIGEDGILYTNACDDLAAVAAALAAVERLRELNAAGEATEDVRLLFTRAEEIGFIGAIAACRQGTIERGARVIALENSRSFADSPIGGGPILRVGDRVSIFSPVLTAAIGKRAAESTGGDALPRASQRQEDLPKRRWQRKLMAGGACEASVFCAYGYESTCLCLPLGNYHNMPHLTELQAGTYDRERCGPPRAAQEFISVADFDGLVDLLVAVGTRLPAADPFMARIEKLYAERAYVL